MSPVHQETVPSRAISPSLPSAVPPLTVVCERAGTSVLLEVHGDVDYATAPVLAGAVHDAVSGVGARPETVSVDLYDVRFLDSSGIAVLLECKGVVEHVEAGLILANPSPTVCRSLELVGLLQAFGL